MSMSLGKAIALVRAARDFNQLQLAEQVGITGSYLSMIESNQRIPSWPLLLKISEALSVKLTLIIMLTESDDPALAPYMPLVYKAIIEGQGLLLAEKLLPTAAEETEPDQE